MDEPVFEAIAIGFEEVVADFHLHVLGEARNQGQKDGEDAGDDREIPTPVAADLDAGLVVDEGEEAKLDLVFRLRLHLIFGFFLLFVVAHLSTFPG